MLSFMGENKRLLKIHEQKFAEIAAFQANTNVFQAIPMPLLKIWRHKWGNWPWQCITNQMETDKEKKEETREETKLGNS